jgi:hypothetical protein
MLSIQVEELLMIKKYRTPQALRSFSRLFTLFLPPFYAPFYATMAVDLGSLGIGITFSVVTSIALTALFESLSQLEDPFMSGALDCIDVEAELRDEFLVELIDIRDHRFPDAPPFKMNIQIPVTKRGPQIRLFTA